MPRSSTLASPGQSPPLQVPHEGGSKTQLRRGRLLARLVAPTPRRLLLVHAPAGFGKTTLLMQYRGALAQQRHGRVVWMTLEEADNDIRRFVQRLGEAFVRHSGIAEDAALRELPGLSMLDRIEVLFEPDLPTTLFVDEFEVIRNPAVMGLVRELIPRLPTGSEIAIGSRHLPNIGVPRLRMHGELLEIDSRQLRFSLEETAALLRDCHGQRLDDSRLAALHRRSEGWVAVLHLFALSYSEQPEPEAFLDAISRSDAPLTEKFVNDILQRLPPDVSAFLLGSSVLGEFSIELANAALSRSDSAEMVDFLERRELFLNRIDRESDGYRYHGLFADMLRRRTSPPRIRQLHLNAANWYIAQDREVRGIFHLLEAGDLPHALSLIQVQAPVQLAKGRVRLLLRWFERIPSAVLEDFPHLQLILAWSLVLNRRYGDAGAVLERMRSNGGLPEDLDIETRTIETLGLSMSDRMRESYEAAEANFPRLHRDKRLQYGVLTNILVYCLTAMDRFDEGRRILSRLLSFQGARQGGFSRTIAASNEASIDLIQGRLGTALARLQDALPHASLSETVTLSIERGRSVAEVLLAIALYERDETEQAMRVLTDVLPYVNDNGTPDQFVYAYLLLSRLYFARGEPALAGEYLDELERQGNASALPRLVASARLGRAWLAWRQGNVSAATHAFRLATAPSHWQAAGPYLAHVVDFGWLEGMRYRLQLATSPGPATTAMLEQAIAEATQRGRLRRALGLRVLLALSQLRSGDQRAALQEIGLALRAASHESYSRVFLDEGPELQSLVEFWFQANPATLAPGRGGDPLLAELRAKLMAGPAPAPLLSPAAPGEDPLSERELDVLKLLATGLRNTDIAARLFISETTVRTHLRNINLKLSAGSRTQAVAIARQQHLI